MEWAAAGKPAANTCLFVKMQVSAAQDNLIPGLAEAPFQASVSLGKLDFISDLDFSFMKEQHMSHETSL